MFGKKEKEAEVTQVKPPKEDKPPEVGEMKKGDYMIHVYLQEGKAFKSSGDTSNPLVEISCYGTKKYSSSKKDISATSSTYWGAYDFDVSYVYFQKQHTIFHQWVALSNPESQDFNEIRCYLKMSISIQGPGDEQVHLSDSAGLENTENQEIMMPASIKKEFKQVKIRLIKGEKFPKMDTFGTIDAYFTGTFLRKKVKTKVVVQKDNVTPVEQEIWLPIQWPMASDRFILKLFDEDKVTDEIVGSLYFSFKRIVNEIGSEGMFVWRNIYGSPLGVSGSATDAMNEAPEIASTWKGRCLMHLSVFDTKSPEYKVVPLDNNFKQSLVNTDCFDLHEFEIIAEVGAGICLPGKTKYTIKIQINDFVLQTEKPKEVREGYCRWSERLPLTSFKAPYKTIDELARVYVYLMDGSDPICFWQGMCKDFVDPNPEFKWIVLQQDKAIGKVKNEFESGLIGLKLCINDKQNNPNVKYDSYAAWKKPPPKRLSSYKIRCYIFQCRDIPSADSDGASDAYVSLWNPDGKKDIKTVVVEDNVNPIFFQTLELHYDYNNLDDAPPVVLNLWDFDDAILDSDDFLGRSVVYLKDASICEDDGIPEPKWHDIRLSLDESMPPCGQMLLSFSVVPDDYAYKIPIQYLKLTEQIEYNNYVVEINILGLRNLESFGLMPVKKPFIRFNLRSLLPPEKAQAITNIKTQPNAPGANPNINTMINFQVDLPVNPLYCPKLQCDVYDYVYKGLVQPLIGTFQLPIGDIMHEQRVEREQQLKQSEEIMKFLKKLIEEGDIRSPVRGEEEEEKKQQRMSQYDKLQAQEIDDSEFHEKKQLLGGPQTDEQQEEEKDLAEEQKDQLFDEQKISEDLKSDLKTSIMRKKQKSLLKEGTLSLIQEMQYATNLKLLEEQQAQKELQKQRRQTQRMKDQQTIKQKFKEEAHLNIITPKYEFDDRLKIKREVNKPPQTLFMELGYNEDPPENAEDDKKHYRKYYDDELENNKEIFPRHPFHTADIIRGQSRGLKKSTFNIFSSSKTDESGQVTNQKIVGLFKGRVHIENYDDREDFNIKKKARIQIIIQLLNDLHQNIFGTPLEFKMSDLESYEKQRKFEMLLEKMGCDEIDILGFLKEQSYSEMITRQMLMKTKALVRIYMIDGYDFAQKDIGSASDPYLIIECGSRIYNERDRYQLDEPNPKFHQMFEFDAEFPGASPLKIQAYDYDDLFGDDLIGETIIDLDDRFFSPEWQQLGDKLIESRQLYHPSASNSQGVVRCWLEIHPTSSSTKLSEKVWDIKPMPLKDYEVRVVVWDTEEVKVMDVEDVSDVFVKVHIDDKDKRQTDCHYRCQEGKASFNYRLLYDVKAPRNDYKLTLQTWDRDLFKSNDFIGEAQIDLKDLFEDAIVMKNQMALDEKYYKNYLSKKHPNLKLKFYDEDSFYVDTVDKDGKFAGRVRLTVHVVPKEMADKNKVGAGRAEPNHSPFCPPPVGRIKFSLNPIEMFFQFVGPEMRKKVYMYCCLALCLTICILIFPIVFSDIISAGILSIFS